MEQLYLGIICILVSYIMYNGKSLLMSVLSAMNLFIGVMHIFSWMFLSA